MKTRNFIILSIFLLLFFGLYSIRKNPSKLAPGSLEKKAVSGTGQGNENEGRFLIEGYPIATVPLYKNKAISSAKFYVNKDPSRFADYFGKAVNYYNIVFKTDSAQSETLSYYRSLMKEQYTEFVPDTQVQGMIGKYKVSVSQYPDASPKEIYLQVYLPQNEYSEKNPFQKNIPLVFERDPSWVEYESGYGLLNQKGGEVEWVQYYPLPEKKEERESMIQRFKEKHANETDFVLNAETGEMSWMQKEYSVVVTFSRDHGRIYIMIRKPMDKTE